MGIAKNQIKEIFENRSYQKDLMVSDIPDINLYIDQITTLFENKLGDSKRTQDDKILTKTMVNNYSKEGILRPVKGKKYDKEHILQMSMIYLMKQTLSIQDIKKIFCSEPYVNLPTYTDAYEKYCEIKSDRTQKLLTQLDSFIDTVDTENDEELLALILFFCNFSTIIKNSVEKIIDRHFEEIKPVKEKDKKQKTEGKDE